MKRINKTKRKEQKYVEEKLQNEGTTEKEGKERR